MSDRPRIAVNIVFILAILFVYFMALYQTAWLCDDAFITYRTVDNFVHGYGMRWNVDERVQSFTHPLWFFLLSILYFITREIYFTPIVLSIFVSLATMAMLVCARIDDKKRMVLVSLCAVFSHAFVDYSTSGLENPLSHLILVSFILFYIYGEPGYHTLFALSFLMALGMLSRLDSIVLFLPCLVYFFLKLPKNRPPAAIIFLLGMAPFAIWSLFSLFYYGFLFPNTAYAKLGAGIPCKELVEAGFLYLLNSLKWDPLTLTIIFSVLVATFLSRCIRLIPMAIGIILYLVYVIRIGGDFMSGRFLALPFMMAIAILCFLPFRLGNVSTFMLISIVMIIGIIVPNPALFGGCIFSFERRALVDSSPYVIGDGPMWCYDDTSLRNPNATVKSKAKQYRQLSKTQKVLIPSQVDKSDQSGIRCFFQGPDTHFIDIYALSDPLLARIPAVFNPQWRIGHFERYVPDGYHETLLSGVNHLADSSLAEYYEHLNFITRGPLFSLRRCSDIVKFNLGVYDSLVNKDVYKFPQLTKRISLKEWKDGTATITNLHPESIPVGGIHIGLGAVRHASSISFEMKGSPYLLLFMRGNETVGILPAIDSGVFARMVKGREPTKVNALLSYIEMLQQCFKTPKHGVETLALPSTVSTRGYDAIRILCLNYNQLNAIVHLELGPE